MSSGKHRRADSEPEPPEALPPAEPQPSQGAEPRGEPEPARPTVSGATIVARKNRAAERAARRRAARRRVLVPVLAVLGVVLAGAVVSQLWGGGAPGGDDPAGGSTPPARQLTTLVQVTGPDGVAAASALVGTTSREGSAVALLVPSRLIVDVAGAGEMQFGEAVTLDAADASASALTDLLGVRVSATWVLSAPALAALVDSVGGVQAAVDADVVDVDAGGRETVVVRAGNQRLGGAAAAAYATYLADGEPEQARLARFDNVLTALAEELPVDSAGLVTLLAGVGRGSQATLDSTALAQRLGVLREAAMAGDLISDVLPVTQLDSGGAVTSYGLDSERAAATIRSRFAAALLTDTDGGVLRVLVENGVGTPGLVVEARRALVDAGFRFVDGGNATPFNDDPSVVLVPDGTEASVQQCTQVAEALGLPASAVRPEGRQQTLADVIVILGADFVP